MMGLIPAPTSLCGLRHPHLIPVVSKSEVRERNASLLVFLYLYSKPRRSGAIRQFVITGASYQLASAFVNGGGSDSFRVVSLAIVFPDQEFAHPRTVLFADTNPLPFHLAAIRT